MSTLNTGTTITTTAAHDDGANVKVWEQLSRLGYNGRETQLYALRVAAKMQLQRYPTSMVSERISVLLICTR